MFSLIRKITKNIFKNEGKMSNFSFYFSPKLQIKFLNNLFIQELEFKLIYINDSSLNIQLQDIRILDIQFKHFNKKNQHFLPFVVYYDKHKIEGSIVLTMKANEVIIEKRINSSLTIKASIQTKLKLANQEVKTINSDQVITNFNKHKIEYISTVENWVVQNNNELVDLFEIKDNKKYMKKWKATYNNKNYHTIKIKAGVQDEKI
ncbi:hypothetical protein HF996_03045 [Mycoplasma sp. 1654_15]|nr:hypothetical protein HF996_03045 [Mycoplasma sp. 1654_15]